MKSPRDIRRCEDPTQRWSRRKQTVDHLYHHEGSPTPDEVESLCGKSDMRSGTVGRTRMCKNCWAHLTAQERLMLGGFDDFPTLAGRNVSRP